MTDYTVARGKDARRIRLIAAIVGLVLVVGGLAFLHWSNGNSRDRAIADASAATGADKVSGPPCDPGTPAGKLGRGDAWKTLTFNQVEYGRRVGNADCGVAKDKSKSGFKSVCRFNAPAELRIVAKDGPHYFDLGLGVPATVIVADSGVSCVKG